MRKPCFRVWYTDGYTNSVYASTAAAACVQSLKLRRSDPKAKGKPEIFKCQCVWHPATDRVEAAKRLTMQ